MKYINQRGMAAGLIILIVLAILLASGVSWYFISYQKVNKNSNIVVTPVINQNTNAAVNTNINVNAVANVNTNTNSAPMDTTNWQVFHNNTYNYQVLFPQNWYYLPDAMTGPPPPASAFFANVQSTSAANYASLNIVVSQLMKESLDTWAEISSLEQDGYSKNSITVSGQPAVYLERKTHPADNGGTIYVEKVDYMYRLVWGATDNTVYQTNEQILKAMADSFKFVDPLVANFNKTGNISLPSNAQNDQDWYLVYEAPGNPAITAKLLFDYRYIPSKCIISGAESQCSQAIKDGQVQVGDRVSVEGVKLTDGSVIVLELTK